MNLGQIRVLAAVLRLPAEFTTADVVREAGVSNELVRKTFSRYKEYFEIVRGEPCSKLGGARKVRRLGEAGRNALMMQLNQNRSTIPLPDLPVGSSGEPFGLEAAENVFYDLLPVVERGEREHFLRVVQSHLDLVVQENPMIEGGSGQSPAWGPVIVLRHSALIRMFGWAKVLNAAETFLLDKNVASSDASTIGEFGAMLLNAALAQNKVTCAPIYSLLNAKPYAADEVSEIAHAMLGLALEPAWLKSIGVTQPLLSEDDQEQLQMISTERTLSNAPWYLDPVVIVNAPGTLTGSGLADFVQRGTSVPVIDWDPSGVRHYVVDMHHPATFRKQPAYDILFASQMVNRYVRDFFAEPGLIRPMRYSDAQKGGIQPIAVIKAYATHSQQPDLLTAASVGAIRKLLAKTGWKNTTDLIDLWEVNDCFATMAAMHDLGIPQEKIQVHDCSTSALGDPAGNAGMRVIVTLLYTLQKHGLTKGLAALCTGRGEATAIAIERVSDLKAVASPLSVG